MLNSSLNLGLQRLKAAIATLILLALVGVTGVSVQAQQAPEWKGLPISNASTVPLLPSKVALTIAEYTNTNSGAIGRVLQRLGASASSFPDGFSQYPPIQQLQWGYASVESTSPGMGDQFVSAFVQSVAVDVPSIRSDQDIWGIVGDIPTDLRRFEFGVVNSSSAIVSPDPAVARVIALISDVVSSRGSNMTVRAVMVRRLGLSTDEVVEAMLRFRSGRSALADQLAKLPNPPQKQRLAEIARDLLVSTPAARSNIVLGEAVFRWIGLDDPMHGEWFRIRDALIDGTEQGRMNAPEAQKAAARAVVRDLRFDAPKLIEGFLKFRDSLDASNVERLFFEYVTRKPGLAALWGFGVIGLMENFDYERYIPGEVRKFERKVGSPIGADERKKVEDLLRGHGPKPHHGYSEYARITGFQTVRAADDYFGSGSVQKAVGDICPVPG